MLKLSLFLLSLFIVGGCCYYLGTHSTNQGIKLNDTQINKLLVEPANGNTSSTLKKEYFDSLTTVWGHVDENNNYIGEAFNSEYSSRTPPSPITHPIEINQEKIEIKVVNKEDIKPSFGIPEGPDRGKFTESEIKTIENNSIKYGDLLGNFFSNKGEMIDNIEEADVDIDGKKEKLIITSLIGGNHTPNYGYIIKNDTVIASIYFVAGSIYPSQNGNGFYVKKPDYSNAPMCCPENYILYRVIFENDRFTPVWEQTVKYLQLSE